MFDIMLFDIGGKKNDSEFNTSVDTLREAELLACADIGKQIDRHDISLVHQHSLRYDVISDDECVGWIVIKGI